MANKLDECLNNPFSNKVQAYMSKLIQVSHLIDWMIRQVRGPVVVWHSTFSISEEFLRSIITLRARYEISGYNLILDRKGLMKCLKLKGFINKAVDKALAVDNHSKVIVVCSEDKCLMALTSQNLTRGNRWESTVVTSDADAIESVMKGMRELMDGAIDLCD